MRLLKPLKKENKARKFKWMSSSDVANTDSLEKLSKEMLDFYSNLDSRKAYQEMVDQNDSEVENPGIVTSAFLKYLKELDCKSILEVGCGGGRIFSFINKYLPAVNYTGIEVSPDIVIRNQSQFPFASWLMAGAYDIPVVTGAADVCFSFYVLEHLVYPEKALNEMLRTIKKDGYLILIFPDFTVSGRFPSQKIGFGKGATAMERLVADSASFAHGGSSPLYPAYICPRKPFVYKEFTKAATP